MILTFNLTAAEQAGLQARADAYNAEQAARRADPSAVLSLDAFVALDVQRRIIDPAAGAFVTAKNDALIAGVLSLPVDQRATVEAIVAANPKPNAKG